MNTTRNIFFTHHFFNDSLIFVNFQSIFRDFHQSILINSDQFYRFPKISENIHKYHSNLQCLQYKKKVTLASNVHSRSLMINNDEIQLCSADTRDQKEREKEHNST